MVRFSQTLDDAPSRNQKNIMLDRGNDSIMKNVVLTPEQLTILSTVSFLDQNRLKDQFVGMRNMLSLRPMNRLM